jgi:Tol biopolymer transport system component
MRSLSGILLLVVALAGCSSDREPAANGGQLLAAGLPAAAASVSEAEQDSSPMVVRRLWFNTMHDIWGGPPAEGRYLSVTEWTGDGGGALAVHDLRTGETRRVTPEPSPYPNGYAEHSVVSPDAERIAYSWWSEDEGYELRLIDFDGSDLRVLYHDPLYEVRPLQWSADGEYVLVFAVDNRDNRIGLISRRDGSFRVLKRLGQREPFATSVSPDGRHVIYDLPVGRASQRDIFVITVATGEERLLVGHPADELVLAWAPDGKQVLFASDRTGTLSAWLQPMADGTPAGDPRLVKPDLWRARPLGFSSAGSFFYVVPMFRSDVYLATVDLETGQLLDQPARATESYLGGNGAPEWSPDGRYLAYLSGRKPWRAFGDEVITIRSMETGEIKELQPNLTSLIYPRWSPDQQSLLLRGKDETGRGLFQIDVLTGEVEPAFRFPPGSPNWAVRMAWLAEGKQVVYWWPEGESRSLRIRDLDTDDEKVLYEDGSLSPRFGLSPDRQHLAFAVKDSDGAHLMVMPTAGGTPRVVLGPDNLEERPVEIQWSPDGRHIYYLLEDLWIVSVEGGTPEKLEWFKEANCRPFFRFEPGGQRVALQCGEGDSGLEVWVMEDFLPATAGTSDEK